MLKTGIVAMYLKTLAIWIHNENMLKRSKKETTTTQEDKANKSILTNCLMTIIMWRRQCKKFRSVITDATHDNLIPPREMHTFPRCAFPSTFFWWQQTSSFFWDVPNVAIMCYLFVKRTPNEFVSKRLKHQKCNTI